MRMMLIVPMMFLGACQTTPKSVVPKMQTWEEHIRDHPSTYIQSTTEHLAAERLRLEQLGLAEDYEAVRELVDAYLPPGNYASQEPGVTAAILRRQRVDSTTVFLIRTGYRARHLAHPVQARTLVRVAASGWNDADALVLASPIVLVADLDRIDRRPDGSSHLVYRVTERIKSAPPIGNEVRLQLNGPMAPVTAPPGAPPPPMPPPNPGMEELTGHKRVVLFLRLPETITRSGGCQRAGTR